MFRNEFLRFLTVVLAAWLVVPSAMGSDDPIQLARIAGGTNNAVAICGSHAVFNVGSTLQVADISIPESPWIVGEMQLPFVPGRIKIIDDRALIVAGSGLLMVDLAAPSAPILAGSLDLPGAGPVAVQGEYAFVIVGSAVRVIDLVDPENMVEVGRHEIEGLDLFGLSAADGHLYVTAYESPANESAGSLHVLDISSPVSPVEVGVLNGVDSYVPDPYGPIAYCGSHVLASSSTVFLAHSREGMRVVDVSDPSSPQLISHLPAMNETRMAFSSGFLFTFGDSLWIFDVSNPAAPVEVGRTAYLRNYGESDLAVSGEIVLLTGSSVGGGIAVVDASQPANPVELASMNNIQHATDVEVVDDYMFVTDGMYPCGPTGWCFPSPYEPSWGMRVFDIHDPENPVEVAAALPGETASAVEIHGGFAFIGTFRGLEIVDVSQPLSPVEVASFWIPERSNYVRDMVFLEHHLFLSILPGGLYIFDVSDPYNPELETVTKQYGSPQGLETDGIALFVAGYYGLTILDVTDPVNPVETASFGEIFDPYSLDLSEDFVFVAGDGGLQIIDMRNPEPAMVGSFLTGQSGSRDVDVKGDRAFITTREGMRIIDFADPARPLEVGRSEFGQISLAIHGSKVIATGRMGVTIFCGQGCCNQPSNLTRPIS